MSAHCGKRHGRGLAALGARPGFCGGLVKRASCGKAGLTVYPRQPRSPPGERLPRMPPKEARRTQQIAEPHRLLSVGQKMLQQ